MRAGGRWFSGPFHSCCWCTTSSDHGSVRLGSSSSRGSEDRLEEKTLSVDGHGHRKISTRISQTVSTVEGSGATTATTVVGDGEIWPSSPRRLVRRRRDRAPISTIAEQDQVTDLELTEVYAPSSNVHDTEPSRPSFTAYDVPLLAAKSRDLHEPHRPNRLKKLRRKPVQQKHHVGPHDVEDDQMNRDAVEVHELSQNGHGPLPAEPLHSAGPTLRNATARQVVTAIEGDTNLFTSQPYSEEYYHLLTLRRRLPVFDRIDDFYDLFAHHQVIVVDGGTGTGKTTQIPQFVAYADVLQTTGKMVVCTEPRRLAAVAAARRVALEMDVEFVKQVGYTIRHEDMTDWRSTFLKYTTDGMLLREGIKDPLFTRYSTVIVDEAHERQLQSDILLGLLKAALQQRPDLHVVVMSASVDAGKFSDFFSLHRHEDVPVLTVPGRIYPVEILYFKPEVDYEKAACDMALKIHAYEAPGDILMFLTGEDEIQRACTYIQEHADARLARHPDTAPPLECVPLYSALTLEEQQRAFDPPPRPAHPSGPPGRKIIVATNIAESSLTIDGVVYVVDPGLSKQRVYDPKTRMASLAVRPISRASARQRAGRSGRTRAGKCFRLYTREHYRNDMPNHDMPEILRSDIAGVILIMLNMGDLLDFDYVDPPPRESLVQALDNLMYLGAIDGEGNLLPQGKLMAEFPLEPHLSRMLLASKRFNCNNEILSIVSMLSAGNAFLRPRRSRRAADAAHTAFTIPDGDHLSLLNVFNNYKQNMDDTGWPSSNFLSERTLAEAVKIRKQLQRIMRRLDIQLVTTASIQANYRGIRRALLCGMFMHVAQRQGTSNTYKTAAENQIAYLHPHTGVDRAHLPEWIIFDEFIQTGRRPYLRTVTPIDPYWLLEYAGDYYNLTSFPEGSAKDALVRLKQEMSVRNVT